MCRGGGGLGATSPHKPACKNCSSLRSFLLRSSHWSFCHLLKNQYAPLCFPAHFQWWKFTLAFFFVVVVVQLFHSLYLSMQTSSAGFCTLKFFLWHIKRVVTLAGMVVVMVAGINSRKSQDLPPIHPPICMYSTFAGTDTHARTANKWWVLGTVVLFSVRGNLKISSENLGCQTFLPKGASRCSYRSATNTHSVTVSLPFNLIHSLSLSFSHTRCTNVPISLKTWIFETEASGIFFFSTTSHRRPRTYHFLCSGATVTYAHR